MKNISIEEAREKHDKLRDIMEKYGNPEFGDCIVDEISWLFDFPTTTDTEPEGEFTDDGEYELVDYTFRPFNTDDGFTNIEVRDFNGDFLGEIAGVEFPDENDLEEILKFESVLIAWLKGKKYSF